MKFLLDTNIVIPLEPTSTKVEPISALAAEFLRLAQGARHQVFLHPVLRTEAARDRDRDRHATLSVLISKYLILDSPPQPTPELSAAFGNPAANTNDWGDLQYVAALRAEAVDYLVTQDAGIHRRAKRVGLDRRVVYLADALSVVRGLLPVPPSAPPAVHLEWVYNLAREDTIWESLRDDYPEFDEWLKKCKRDHRQAWVIWGANRSIAGLCMMKEEAGPELGMDGKILKLTTFKVSEASRGFRYGELLLKAAFETARVGNYDWMYVTAFPRQVELLDLFETFGFSEADARIGDEVVMRRRLSPSPEDLLLHPAEFHRRFGPHLLKLNGARIFVVPVQPHYHALLFPEAEQQLSITSGLYPFGNAIRKAYLCHAPTRQIEPGSVLLFYRSTQGKEVRVVGVAEETLVSSSAQEIARFVGTRTVYSLPEIEVMANRTVLAILFRQARLLPKALPYDELRRLGVLKGPPQSIVEVTGSAQAILANLMDPPGRVRPSG